jgi:hypothetical protein
MLELKNTLGAFAALFIVQNNKIQSLENCEVLKSFLNGKTHIRTDDNYFFIDTDAPVFKSKADAIRFLISDIENQTTSLNSIAEALRIEWHGLKKLAV